MITPEQIDPKGLMMEVIELRERLNDNLELNIIYRKCNSDLKEKLKRVEDMIKYIEEGAQFVESNNAAVSILSRAQIVEICQKALKHIRGES